MIDSVKLLYSSRVNADIFHVLLKVCLDNFNFLRRVLQHTHTHIFSLHRERESNKQKHGKMRVLHIHFRIGSDEFLLKATVYIWLAFYTQFINISKLLEFIMTVVSSRSVHLLWNLVFFTSLTKNMFIWSSNKVHTKCKTVDQ